MPCLAQEFHPKLPAANHDCKSLSSHIRETYAHCHVPSCVRIPAGAGWSSGDHTDDDSVLEEAQDTKQVILNEMRNRQMKKRSRCSVDSSTLPLSSSPAAFAWSYTPLDPRTVLDKVSSPKTCVVVEGTTEEKDEEETADDGDGYCDADDESEAFFSVKSFFTRSTSRCCGRPRPGSASGTARGGRSGCAAGRPSSCCRRCPARRPTRGSGARASAASPRAQLLLTDTKSLLLAVNNRAAIVNKEEARSVRVSSSNAAET